MGRRRGLLFLEGATRNLYYAHLVYAMQLSRAISFGLPYFFSLSLFSSCFPLFQARVFVYECKKDPSNSEGTGSYFRCNFTLEL